MAALDFQRDGDSVTITHDGSDRTFTVARLREIVTTYLTYYREGVTDLSITLGYTLDAKIYGAGCPSEFDADCREYWSHRLEIYQYADSEKLFPITLVTHTAAEADIAFVTQQWMARMGKADYITCHETWKLFDAALVACDLSNDSERRSLIPLYAEACQSTLMCPLVHAIALEQYGIADREEACKCCSHYAMCCEMDGAQYQIDRFMCELRNGSLTEETAAAMRQGVASSVGDRDAFVANTITNWSV